MRNVQRTTRWSGWAGALVLGLLGGLGGSGAGCGGAAECPAGEVMGALRTCEIDRRAPPCRCAAEIRCCSGDVCVSGASSTAYCDTCPIQCIEGTLVCTDGELSVGDGCQPQG